MRLEPVYHLGRAAGEPLGGTLPLDLDALVPGSGGWEVELGYGKGRFLLGRALGQPERRFLGIEVVSKYHKLLSKRMRARGVENLLNLRGEALFLLSTLLPRGFAERVHVYFPDPWPKAKHRRRRLFDPQTVDLVLGTLRPGGALCFATDFLEYGEVVMDLLAAHPHLEVEPVLGPWPDGARTNYEAKYMEEGRPIVRAIAHLDSSADPAALHPDGIDGVTCAWPRDDEADPAAALAVAG
ncbi:MAG: hypothetical protein AAGN46_13295 [Acidobacteriota bacterium]